MMCMVAITPLSCGAGDWCGEHTARVPGAGLSLGNPGRVPNQPLSFPIASEQPGEPRHLQGKVAAGFFFPFFI